MVSTSMNGVGRLVFTRGWRWVKHGVGCGEVPADVDIVIVHVNIGVRAIV